MDQKPAQEPLAHPTRLRMVAALQCPQSMARWQTAYEQRVLRDMGDDSSAPDPTSPDDPANVAAETEALIEQELLPLLLSAGHELTGHLDDCPQRTAIRLLPIEAVRLVLDCDGLLEVGSKGETVNRWRDVEVQKRCEQKSSKAESELDGNLGSVGSDNQAKFDAELRQRRGEGESQNGSYRDPMVQWAKDELTNGDRDLAEQLWECRSKEFPHKGGRPKSSTLKSGN